MSLDGSQLYEDTIASQDSDAVIRVLARPRPRPLPAHPSSRASLPGRPSPGRRPPRASLSPDVPLPRRPSPRAYLSPGVPRPWHPSRIAFTKLRGRGGKAAARTGNGGPCAAAVAKPPGAQRGSGGSDGPRHLYLSIRGSRACLCFHILSSCSRILPSNVCLARKLMKR